MNISELESLWRQYVSKFSQDGLRLVLDELWPNDKNLERIQYDLPPTFQPGYVGSKFGEARVKVLIISYNPGDGARQSSRELDSILHAELRNFAEGVLTFEDFNDFLASHLVKWPLYAGKGILNEAGDRFISLLPEALDLGAFLL